MPLLRPWLLTCTPDATELDAISGMLTWWGAQGCWEEHPDLLDPGHLHAGPGDAPQPLALTGPVHLTACFPSPEEAQAAAVQLEHGFPNSKPELAPAPDEDWQQSWKSHYAPLAFGKDLLVLPAWMDPPEPAPRHIVRIDPGQAFGTGTHETTSMILEFLLEHPPVAQSVLDLGTGTGILAFAAARLGATPVLGVEIDPQALANALENRALNQLEDVELILGDCAATEGQWDLLLANLLAPVLMDNAHHLAQRLAPGGTLLASGLLHDQEPSVLAALAAQGLTPLHRHRKGEWSLLELQPSRT